MITASHQALDPTDIITKLGSTTEVRRLPRGVVVGDRSGGRTFNDNVAAALERRSFRGWLQMDEWTVIVIERNCEQ